MAGKVYFQPPEASKRFARMGLDAREAAPKSKKCCLTTQEAGKQGIGSGLARARDILADKKIDARQVKAYFDRHQGYYRDALARAKRSKTKLVVAALSEPSIQGWWIWGGDPAYRAATKALAQHERKVTNPPLDEPDATGFAPGDAIARKWLVKGVPGYHYGVYIGDFKVAHADRTCGQVVIVDYEDFACDRHVFADGSATLQPEDRAATIERAYSACGLPYKLFSYNCEHFASWCTTGNARSAQKHAWFRRGSVLVGTVVLVAVVNPGDPPIMSARGGSPRALHEGTSILVARARGGFEPAVVLADVFEGQDDEVPVKWTRKGFAADAWGSKGHVAWKDVYQLSEVMTNPAGTTVRGLKARLL